MNSEIATPTSIESAQSIRAYGKEQGLKGNKLSAYVNERLRAQQPMADAAIGHLGREGYLVKSMVQSKSGMVTVKYAPPAKVSAGKLATAEAEIAHLKAQLAKINAAKGASAATVEVPAMA